MHHLTLWQVNLCAWYAFLIVWGIAALKHKPDKATEPLPNRLLYGTYLVCGFTLLFSHSLSLGPLRLRFAPHLNWLELTGVILTYAGAATAIWARFILADNWSGRITVKVGHQLIRTGPYAYVRHPIYTGILLSVTGTALLVGEWRGLLAIPLVAMAFAMKAKREEAYMTAEFGEGYLQYQQTTGFLLPKLSLSRN
ncbi:MAG TPA: isoprenylcysteine carboxylmethyltransferase family protein [Terriglobales bacterium]|nr:isoprenylcysteine carboxylmethyltransferase family protein [Terriglobales bacterium]